MYIYDSHTTYGLPIHISRYSNEVCFLSLLFDLDIPMYVRIGYKGLCVRILI